MPYGRTESDYYRAEQEILVPEVYQSFSHDTVQMRTVPKAPSLTNETNNGTFTILQTTVG
jgi:hypothetical protein